MLIKFLQKISFGQLRKSEYELLLYVTFWAYICMVSGDKQKECHS
jgi:hypothetical protein